MRRPVGIRRFDRFSGTRVRGARGQFHHRDAILDRADIDAEIAGHAFIVDHAEGAVFGHGNRLVRGVFAGRKATPARDAQILINLGLGDIVQVQLVPVGHIRHRTAHQLIDRRHPLVVHIFRQAADHFLDDLKAIGHHGGTDLHVPRPKCEKLCRVAPCGHAADTTDRHISRGRVAGNLGHHVQRNWFHCRSAITAMGAFAVNRRFGCEQVQIDRGDRVDRVDQAHRIRTTAFRGLGGIKHIGDVRRQLHDHRHARVLLAPAGDHFNVFRHLPHGRSHAAFRHAVRAAEVQLDPVGTGFLHMRQDRFPRFLLARDHDRRDQSAVRVITFHRLHLAQVHLKRAVGDQLDVIEPQQPPVRSIDGTVARAVDVDDRRALHAERFPHDTAPPRLEGAADVVFFVRWRRGCQPERVRAFDAHEVAS